MPNLTTLPLRPKRKPQPLLTKPGTIDKEWKEHALKTKNLRKQTLQKMEWPKGIMKTAFLLTVIFQI